MMQLLQVRPDLERCLQHDIGRFDAMAELDITETIVTHDHVDITHDGLDRDTPTLGLLGIDLEVPDIVGTEHVVIDIDQVRHRLEGIADLRCRLAPGFGIGPIDFGDDGLQHRRSGRHLDDGKACVPGLRDRLQ